MTEQSEHLVKSFDQDLKRLTDMLIRMGGIVENQVALAAEAVMDRNAAAATRTVEDDVKVDALQFLSKVHELGRGHIRIVRLLDEAG